jgi:MOSC domain-containing protein YiiM
MARMKETSPEVTGEPKQSGGRGCLEAVLVGLPRAYMDGPGGHERSQVWTSGIAKHPVSGAVRVGTTNLAGDGQADLSVHGGPDKAILGYASAHYPHWARDLGVELPAGAFGENLLIAGQDEDSVCIGDTYAIGSAVLQVSQPRQPCWKLASRWGVPTLPALVERSGRGGWYLRVVQAGELEAGDQVELIGRPQPDWTVRRVQVALRAMRRDRAAALAVAGIPALAGDLRAKAAGMAERDQPA